VMRRIWRLVFVATSLGFMLWVLVWQWRQIRGLHWDARPSLLLLAVVLLVAMFFLDALGWHLVLRALGARANALANIRTWMLSSLGRYMPGAVWGFVGRIAMSTEQGIPATTAVLALYLETLAMCAGAFTVGLPAAILAADFPLQPRMAVLAVALVLLLLQPRTLALLRYIPGKIGHVFANAKLPSAMRVFALYLYYTGFWAAFGFVFVVFIASLQTVPLQAVLPLGGSMGLSFALGFVAVFAPGGLGVRESALYFLMLPYLPPSACLLIAIGSRLWIMAGEAISLLLALCLWHFRSQPGR